VTRYHPGVTDKLALDSPLWERLSACYSAENAIVRLREIVATGQLDEAWEELCGQMLHQGTVYGVTSAAIPHLVDLAPRLSMASRRDLWIEMGFMVTAGADQFPSPPAPGLQEGLTRALRAAEPLAVRDFLDDTEVMPDTSSYYALVCVALAGHRVGNALWEFPSSYNGYVRFTCPGCEAESQVDGFADPLVPPCPVPSFGWAPADATTWHSIADAIERAKRDQVLGPGWDGFLETARRVAAAGVPKRAPARAVWCLVAAMVATTSAKAAPWARTLMRLAGHVRCVECGLVWAIGDLMSDISAAMSDVPNADLVPVTVAYPGAGEQDAGRQGVLFTLEGEEGAEALADSDRVPHETVADGVAGFPPSPQRKLLGARVAMRELWRAGIGAVDALALAPGEAAVVIAGTGDATTSWDLASGRQVGPPMPGGAGAVASVNLPDGRAVVAVADGEGGLRWWDASSGRRLRARAKAGSARIRSLAPVLMPVEPKATVDWVARLRDGRTVLAAGSVDGTIRLWDPASRKPVRDLFQRAGRPWVSLTAVDFSDQPPWTGTDVVVVYGDRTIDVWDSGAVHGERSTMAPDERKLLVLGHQRIIGVAVSPERLGHRRPILLADRDGRVSMWETFGVRLGDPLPPDPAHDEVVGVAALPAPDGGIVVATASRASRNLRLWQPLEGAVALVPLDVRPRCLLGAGDTVVIGHDGGLLTMSLDLGGAGGR
jgi:hypothetical protein